MHRASYASPYHKLQQIPKFSIRKKICNVQLSSAIVKIVFFLNNDFYKSQLGQKNAKANKLQRRQLEIRKTIAIGRKTTDGKVICSLHLIFLTVIQTQRNEWIRFDSNNILSLYCQPHAHKVVEDHKGILSCCNHFDDESVNHFYYWIMITLQRETWSNLKSSSTACITNGTALILYNPCPRRNEIISLAAHNLLW